MISLIKNILSIILAASCIIYLPYQYFNYVTPGSLLYEQYRLSQLFWAPILLLFGVGQALYLLMAIRKEQITVKPDIFIRQKDYNNACAWYERLQINVYEKLSLLKQKIGITAGSAWTSLLFWSSCYVFIICGICCIRYQLFQLTYVYLLFAAINSLLFIGLCHLRNN